MVRLKSSMICSLFSLAALFFSGCGGGGPTTPGNQTEATIEEVAAKAQVELPAGTAVQEDSLTLSVGIVGEQKVSSDGSADIVLNNKTSQVVTATNSSGNPVLISVAAPSQEGTSVSLNAESTAVSLVMLHPFIATSDPELASKIKAIIAAQPETETLATLIESKIKQDPAALSKSDPDIVNALADALRVSIAAIDSEVEKAKKQKVSIVPESMQSGLTVTATEPGSDGTSTITVENAKRRYVAVYLKTRTT